MFSVAVGDRVAYSVQFLSSIGMSHTDMAHAKGTVQQVDGREETTIAHIAWDRDEELPKKVLVSALALVGPNARYCKC